MLSQVASGYLPVCNRMERVFVNLFLGAFEAARGWRVRRRDGVALRGLDVIVDGRGCLGGEEGASPRVLSFRQLLQDRVVGLGEGASSSLLVSRWLWLSVVVVVCRRARGSAQR